MEILPQGYPGIYILNNSPPVEPLESSQLIVSKHDYCNRDHLLLLFIGPIGSPLLYPILSTADTLISGEEERDRERPGATQSNALLLARGKKTRQQPIRGCRWAAKTNPWLPDYLMPGPDDDHQGKSSDGQY